MGNDHSIESGGGSSQPSSTSSGKGGGKKQPKDNAHDDKDDQQGLMPPGGSSRPSSMPRQASMRGGDNEDSLASILGLSPYQIQMLCQSWPRVQQTGGHAVGGSLFRKLASKNPECRQAFQKMTIIEGFSPRGGRSVDVYKEHGRLLFDLFNEAVKSLTEPSATVINSCKEYGAKHSNLSAEGFQNRIWDDLSEIIVEHITKTDAVRKHRELCKAWTALITFLVEKVKDGYKNNYRKPSSHPQAGGRNESTVVDDSTTTTTTTNKRQFSLDEQHDIGKTATDEKLDSLSN